MIALIANTMDSSATDQNCAITIYEDRCGTKRALGGGVEDCTHSSMPHTAPDSITVEITDGEAGIVAYMVRSA